MNQLAQIAFFIFFCYIASLQAQDIAPLPKLYASYSEDFSDYSTFPSICFQKSFVDKFGKMWLVVCGTAKSNAALHLFGFDGYNFKPIRGEIEQLPSNEHILGILQGETIVGYIPKPDSNQLFFFDVQTQQLRFEQLDFPGEIMDGVLTKKNSILIIFKQVQQLVIAEWLNEELMELGRISAPEGFRGRSIFFNDNEVWLNSGISGRYLIRFDLRTKVEKKYDQPGFVPSDDHSYWEKADEQFFNQLDHPYLFNKQGSVLELFTYNEQQDRLEPVEGQPASASTGSRVFQDDIGNLLFQFVDSVRTCQAILQDTSGNRFDCSDFFTNIKGIPFSISSPNFKEQAIICTGAGVSILKVRNSNAIRNFLKGSSMRAMAELPDQQFIINSQDRIGDHLLDLKNNSVSKLVLPGCLFENGFFHKAIFNDEKGLLLFFSRDTFIKYNPNTKTCASFPAGIKNVKFFAPIGENQVVIVSKTNVFRFNFSTNETIPLISNGNPIKINGVVNDIYSDQKELVWIATSEGLWKINLVSQKVEVLGYDPPFKDSRFLAITPDRSGRLWLGTPLGGLHIYDPKTQEAKIVNNDFGLPNNTVVSILQDDEEDMWLGTYNGISLVSKNGVLLANFGLEDGLVEKENNRYSKLKANDGTLLIGTTKGLNVINPKLLKASINKTVDFKIYLTSLEYFDSKKGERTRQTLRLNDLETLQLPASQRFLNLTYALSNYIKPKENQYAYKLEGLDKDWIFLGHQNSLSLNNLPPGKYHLLIKGSDARGNWTKQPLSIPIHAKTFFYQTPWFYLLLIAFIGFVALIWIRNLRTEVKKATRKIREDKAVIESQAEKLKELGKAKSRFFTNISHEFRTPLTVISGMTDRIKKAPEQWVEQGTTLIKRNSNNLLDLVNQILDLRKLESGKLETNMIQGNIIPFLQYIFESFQSLAQQKQLQLHFLKQAETAVVMDYDPEKILRIVSNLLSNAIKFTPDGGHVYFMVSTLGVLKTPRVLTIKVKDTGIGIHPKKLPNIFNRFYQVDRFSEPNQERESIHPNPGTGIGLTLTKELINLLNGNIEVSSKMNEGTLFKVTLPIEQKAKLAGNDDYSRNPLIPLGLTSQEITEDSPIYESDHPELPLVLLIEDNEDIVQYLKACVMEQFQVAIALDGQQGIEKAIELVPDAIISDIMMPVKDGYEVCHILKNDERTSHIPIILLTARADAESRLTGLRRGADDYLTKPFNEEELLIRLNNLMVMRQKLQTYFQRPFDDTSSTDPELKIENEFLQKIRYELEAHLSEEDFGIVQLCQAIGMSRTQLHRKVTALTGCSTSQYLKKIRLQKAKELLEMTEMNVTEVAFEVGFRHLQNFSTYYKEEFGIQPSKASK